jgi:peptide/nickel transport system substrate-binding protein
LPKTRTSRSFLFRLLAVVLALSFVAAACGDDDDDDGGTPGGNTDTTEEESKPVRGGTLVYAVEADTSAPWDPTAMLCAAPCHSTVGRTIFEPLAMIDEDGKVAPYLLESIDSNPDATVFTLKLRDGIKFHDNTPLDADAVVFNMERHRKSILIGPAVKLINKVESDGKLTITVTLSESWSAFPLYLNSQIGYVGSPTWEKAADADASGRLKTQPVGTGPFKFKSYESGENGNLKATRWEGYWRGDGPDSVTKEGLPYLDGIEVRFMPSGQARRSAVVSGDIDLMQTSNPLDIVALKKEDSVVVDQMDSPFLTETAYLLIDQQPEVNGQPNPMSDIRVRRALAMATNYELLNKVRGGDSYFPLANGPFPPGTLGYLEDSGAPKYDLEGAKALVEEYEGEKGPLKIAYKTTTDPQNLDTAEFLQQMWAEAGIETSLDQIPQGEFINQALQGNFQVFGWRNHSGADPDQQYVWWTTENTNPPIALNFGRIKSKELDDLMLKIRHSTDEAEKKAAAEDVNRLFAENVWNIWTTWVQWVFAHNPNVHNVIGQDLPDGGKALNIGANLAGTIMPATMYKTK